MSFSVAESLQILMEMLLEFPTIVQNTKLVFVPGPQDPGVSHILPRY